MNFGAKYAYENGRSENILNFNSKNCSGILLLLRFAHHHIWLVNSGVLCVHEFNKREDDCRTQTLMSLCHIAPIELSLLLTNLLQLQNHCKYNSI